MNFDDVIKQRRSVRDFKKSRINWRSILDAVEAALQGPYAGNHNNLKFLIIESHKTIEEIAGFCEQHWIGNAPTIVLVCSDDTHLENLYGERGRIYSRQQAGAAIYSFILKLTDLGLSSCWVGTYSDELIKKRLKIPQHIQIEAIVPVGHPSSKPEKKPKKALENALFWEAWDKSRKPTLFEEQTEDYNPRQA